MDRSELNKINKQPRQNAESFLRALRAIEQIEPRSLPSQKVEQLPKAYKKLFREFRAAAIFCYGHSYRSEQPVDFIPVEQADYDFVATWVIDENRHFAPVQLKELVPERLNPKDSVQSLLNALAKYSSSPDLTVAIYLNRTGRFEPEKLCIPQLDFAAIWIFWAATADKSQWCLYGNMLEQPEITRFAYPI